MARFKTMPKAEGVKQGPRGKSRSGSGRDGIEHTWAATGAEAMKAGRVFQPATCTACGATGKQYRGVPTVTLDAKSPTWCTPKRKKVPSRPTAGSANPSPKNLEDAACLAGQVVVNSPSVTSAVNRRHKVETTISKRADKKSGAIIYSIPGVHASVVFNKSLFAKGAAVPPAFKLIPLDADQNESDVDPFAQPRVKPVRTPLSKAERLARMQAGREAAKHLSPVEKAERIRARAQKQLERADKMAAEAMAEATA